MFKPTYTLSNRLLSNIAHCERLYGQIEALKLPHKLQLNLERRNMIESSYASNRIEGNPLSLPEVTNLLLDDRVPVNRDEKEVQQYFALLEDLPSYSGKEWNKDLITSIHKQLFEGLHEEAGVIRDEIVAVGRYTGGEGNTSFKVKHMPPFYAKSEIVAALEELMAWAKEAHDLPIVLKTGIFHHEFVYIHTFEDGNGRACRVLTALLFMSAGYYINKYFILDDYYDLNRDAYSDHLHTADEGDKTEWLEYYSDGLRFSLESALVRARESVRTLAVKDRPTSKENQVFELMSRQQEITSTEVAKSLKVSRQQAHNLLRSLVDKGLIEKIGTTKSSYYKLK